MTNAIYSVQKNDCPWTVAAKRLKATGHQATSADIAKEMQRLAKLNGCDSVEDFGTKFFNKVGAEFICEEDVKPTAKKQPAQPAPANRSSSKDSIPTVKPEARDCTRVATDPNVHLNDSTRVARNSSVKDTVNTKKRIPVSQEDQFKVEAARINSIKGDKNRIIEYNKTHATGNYVIVDKKTCQATVYNKQGKILKSYEVLLGATKGDDLSTAFAADPNLVASGRRTVPGEFKLSARSSMFGGTRALGDAMETFDPDVKLREWAPGKWGKKKFGTAYQAMHGTADRAHRDKLYNNGNLSDNRQSLGCVNIPVEALNEMEKEFGIGTGSSVYILPETKGNELVLTKRKDGEVKFMTKYKNEAQNVKQRKIQDAIADKNIKRNLAAKRKAEQQRQLAEQQRKESEFSLWKPSTWFS